MYFLFKINSKKSTFLHLLLLCNIVNGNILVHASRVWHLIIWHLASKNMIWYALVKTALIGTDRSTLAAEILSQLQQQGIDTNADAAHILLESAALYSQLRKAGFVLQNFNGQLPEAALVSAEIFCNQISIQHLNSILEGPYKKVLPEFIFVAVQAKKILPPEFLPDFFQLCLRNRTLWNTALPIIGNHGRWLLQQNSAWKRLATWAQESSKDVLSEEAIYPALENKFQIWGSDDVAFQSRPSDFNDLRAFWQSIETRVYENFIQKSLQILLFREQMIKELL